MDKKILNYDLWMRVLLELSVVDTKTISGVSRSMKVTFAHLHRKIIPLLQHNGLVTTHPEGREVIIEITAKGIEVITLIYTIKQVIGKTEPITNIDITEHIEVE